ncbi:hypothetical protein BH09VER1_BH09VER1_50800 [soil metagenome]
MRVTAQALHAAPIASLISKSEKARQKVAPGTWQHTMLQANLAALHLASALIKRETNPAEPLPPADLPAALRALSSMIAKTEAAQPKFPPGTSPHTLLQNRLHALRLAETLIQAEQPTRSS